MYSADSIATQSQWRNEAAFILMMIQFLVTFIYCSDVLTDYFSKIFKLNRNKQIEQRLMGPFLLNRSTSNRLTSSFPQLLNLRLSIEHLSCRLPQSRKPSHLIPFARSQRLLWLSGVFLLHLLAIKQPGH